MTGAHSKRRNRRTGGQGLKWAVGVLLGLALVAFVLVGADGPADPTLGGVPGFGEVAFRVAASGGEVTDAATFCALLADDDAQRATGMMGRPDLAGYDAMVFRFDHDTSSPFHMANVPVPLSVAWFDGSGAFVASADMAPCPTQEGCPNYHAPRSYRVAVEVLQGGLQRLGIGEGSRIEVGGPCKR